MEHHEDCTGWHFSSGTPTPCAACNPSGENRPEAAPWERPTREILTEVKACAKCQRIIEKPVLDMRERELCAKCADERETDDGWGDASAPQHEGEA